MMNFAFEIRRESNPRSYLTRSSTLTTRPTVYDWYRRFPSHVMGTFGTNRIYTVGRVVKVEDLMRFGGWLRAGSIPSVSHMQNSSGRAAAFEALGDQKIVGLSMCEADLVAACGH